MDRAMSLMVDGGGLKTSSVSCPSKGSSLSPLWRGSGRVARRPRSIGGWAAV